MKKKRTASLPVAGNEAKGCKEEEDVAVVLSCLVAHLALASWCLQQLLLLLSEVEVEVEVSRREGEAAAAAASQECSLSPASESQKSSSPPTKAPAKLKPAAGKISRPPQLRLSLRRLQ